MSDGARKDERLHERKDVALACEMEVDGEKQAVTVSNLSVGGCQISAAPLDIDTRVILSVHFDDNLEALTGVVRWASGDSFGVQFEGLRAKQVWVLQQWLKRSQES